MNVILRLSPAFAECLKKKELPKALALLAKEPVDIRIEAIELLWDLIKKWPPSKHKDGYVTILIAECQKMRRWEKAICIAEGYSTPEMTEESLEVIQGDLRSCRDGDGESQTFDI